jgi:HEAT repeat protein
MFKGRRSIRVRTLLILVAGCAILCGLGVQLYREVSPVRRSARQLQAGNSVFTRLNAVATLADTEFLPPWEREDAYRVLLATVDDADLQIRCSAALSLSQHREHAAQVVTALLSLTKDKAPLARETALFAMENVAARGSAEAQAVIQAAISALDDPKPAVRLEAGRALYVLGQGSKGVPALARLVREETGIYRLGGLGFLMAMKTIPADLEPTLHTMLTSDYVWERIWARQALIHLGIPAQERDAMMKAMLGSLHDSERLEGARLLVQFGQAEQAIPVLEEIATHGSNADRAQAHTLIYKATQAEPDRL